MVGERLDLHTVESKGLDWKDLPSDRRVDLKAVLLASTALINHRFVRGFLGIRNLQPTPDSLIEGVTNLEGLGARLTEQIFDSRLTEEGGRKLGEHIIRFTNCDKFIPEDLNGDTLAVKEKIRDWATNYFGVANTS